MELQIATEAMRIESWRLQCLLEAGYPLADANKLATDTTVNLHRAVDLVARHGCRPDLAVAILT